ncbi:hypothetical protein FB468_0766 [Leucobacter komagatae]|uniref:Lipoprotein n=1 Tax=Leucobacter komagatae TaxID=55969 RepID=A0A542Y3W2_9MICO|nr:hypothetical protein FB468_0766 [Leucobacter komagatae]
MRKAALVAMAVLVSAVLTGCTEAERQEAVEPVVREVIESLLAPITAAESGTQS